MDQYLTMLVVFAMAASLATVAILALVLITMRQLRRFAITKSDRLLEAMAAQFAISERLIEFMRCTNSNNAILANSLTSVAADLQPVIESIADVAADFNTIADHLDALREDLGDMNKDKGDEP